MELWETQEGLIPKKELWKGPRGNVLLVLLSLLFYYTVFEYIFEGISAHLRHKYGSPMWMTGFVSIYYSILNPLLHIVISVALAVVIRTILNKINAMKNIKIEKKNEEIQIKNSSQVVSGTQTQNLDKVERLLLRLKKGKKELGKYEYFFKKKKFYNSFNKKKAEAMQQEDEQNGYSEALNRVIWDVPETYRKRKLITKLMKVIKKKRVSSVKAAITIFEKELEIKKGIAGILSFLAIYGIFRAIDKSIEESHEDAMAAARDGGRFIDESRAEGERIRAADRRERELRNRAGAAQAYADRSKANAANLRGTNKFGEGLQWANHAQKGADSAWRDLSNFLRK